MMAALTNHLWQSTLFAVAAALLAFALRKNRADIRHWVWLTASVKFLVPLALLLRLGSALASTPAAPTPLVAPTVSVALAQFTEPFAPDGTSAIAVPARQASSDWVRLAEISVWILGFVVIALMRLRGWQRIRAAVRASTPFPIQTAGPAPDVELRSSPHLLEPGVVGVWRPILLLPQGIQTHLTMPQFEAVLAHEQCHVRRRDNLTAVVHMAVEAVFWFHPMVWWIGARLVEERERACDEYVLQALGTSQAYAEGILNVCKQYVESPLACVSGVTGSDLGRRIEDIMMNRVGIALNSARKRALGVAAMIAVAAPIAVGMVTAPLRASVVRGTQAAAGAVQKFEVASIKPCESEPVPPGARSGGGNGSFSPGRVYLTCFVVKNLISGAYVNQRAHRDPADGLDNWPLLLGGGPEGPQQVRGGPSWVYSEKYTIEATAPGLDPSNARSPDRAVMEGPMLRALLEDRFQLEVHQAVEGVQMWALTVAKGGLKIKPMGPGGCSTDRSNGPITLSKAASLGVKPTCGTVNGDPDGPNWRWEHAGQNLGAVAAMLSSDLGVKVIDQTGIKDLFNITWEYGPDDNTPGTLRWFAAHPPDATGGPTAASVFTALEQQLGLKLERIKGPRGYIVIDHIERPTPNGPAPSALARAAGAGHGATGR